jgi:small GTP-binding protein
MTVSQRTDEIRENLESVQDMVDDSALDEILRGELRPMHDDLFEKQESRRLEIVAFGTISGGKSSLLNALAGRDVFATDARGGTTVRRNEIPWSGDDRVTLVDTPGLGEVDGAVRQATAADAARDADLVLLVVDGPLRDSEFKLLEQLSLMEKRVLVCLNKEDWYDQKQQQKLLKQIADQAVSCVAADDIVAIRSRPTQRERKRLLPDQTETLELVEVEPDIRPLAKRLMQIVRRDGQDLLLANLLLQSRGLVDKARQRVEASIDRRAWEIVDRHMWSAGGAAALSPFPVVDLAAGCAVSTKMILDLARVYRQDVDMEVAVNLLGQQGKNLLAVLGTSAATPAVTSMIASLMKTVPGIGTVAGGVLQGLVQAVVTRWIGGIFIKYFKEEMREPPGGMAGLARREWERITSVAELHKLVKAARHRLTEKEKSTHD